MNFEFPRKSVHLLTLLVPLFSFYSLSLTQGILIFFILFYLFSEYQKIKGHAFFAHRFILHLERNEEKKHFAKAPLFLAVGVLGAISLFSWKASLIGISQAGFSDTMAAWCGKKWGKTALPFVHRKTYIGIIAFFLSALPLSLMILPYSQAVLMALVGAFLEALPFKDWDNLTIPLLCSGLAAILLS